MVVSISALKWCFNRLEQQVFGLDATVIEKGEQHNKQVGGERRKEDVIDR